MKTYTIIRDNICIVLQYCYKNWHMSIQIYCWFLQQIDEPNEKKMQQEKYLII